MNANRIIVPEFDFLNILDCTIHKRVNDHSRLTISGHISDEEKDYYVLNCSVDQRINVIMIDELDISRILFCGIVDDISVKCDGGLNILTIKAVTSSILLDKVEYVKTFQDSGQTYRQVASAVLSGKNASIMYTIGNEAISKMLVQYKETDWQFLKRMASILNSVIVADYINEKTIICFGVPDKVDEEIINPLSYEVEKIIGEYIDKKQNLVNGINEHDSLNFIIESREVCELCSPVEFKNIQLYIYQIDSYLVGSELIHKYHLRTKNGFKTKTQYNEKIIGTSLSGRVAGVSKDMVMVDLDSPASKWFAYTTVYSSVDNAGWYCMPEIGDAVRVYFPNEKENNAYVTNSIHIQGSTSGRNDPNTKTLRTKYGKEIKFTPTSILLTNNNGTYIIMDDEEGIRLESNKTIQLKAQETIDITSDTTVDIQGADGVIIRKNNNYIEIGDTIVQVAETVNIS